MNMSSFGIDLSFVSEIAIVFGFFFADAAGQAQIFVRVRGATVGRIAMGFQWSTEVLLLNRLGAAAYFLMLSFYIESGGTIERLLLLLSFSLVLIIIFNLWMMLKLAGALKISNWSDTFHTEVAVLSAAFVATLFSVLGMTVPYFSGIFFPEYRLTLANSSFVLNTVFTLLIVFVVDKRVASYIDSANKHLGELATLTIGAKTLGLLSMLVVSLVVYNTGIWLQW